MTEKEIKEWLKDVRLSCFQKQQDSNKATKKWCYVTPHCILCEKCPFKKES